MWKRVGVGQRKWREVQIRSGRGRIGFEQCILITNTDQRRLVPVISLVQVQVKPLQLQRLTSRRSLAAEIPNEKQCSLCWCHCIGVVYVGMGRSSPLFTTQIAQQNWWECNTMAYSDTPTKHSLRLTKWAVCPPHTHTHSPPLHNLQGSLQPELPCSDTIGTSVFSNHVVLN